MSRVTEIHLRHNPDFTVLAETGDYIVVDKPAPLLIHPSVPGNPPTLLDGLQGLLAYDIANGAALSIINRLDRETSGVVLVAKNKETARNLNLADLPPRAQLQPENRVVSASPVVRLAVPNVAYKGA